MQVNAGENDAVDEKVLLLAQVREIYARIAYTHKAHEKQADICELRDRRQRTIRIALAAISSGAFLASVLGIVLDAQGAAVATSFVAVLLSASTLFDKTFKYGEEMEQHRDTAAHLWNLRESYLSLIVDIKSETVPVDELRSVRDDLQARAARVLGSAPRTSSKAYGSAQIALKTKEDLTFSDGEIDHLLPLELRDGGERSA
jgi:hypothetical protein